jgi:hypothetical protein
LVGIGTSTPTSALEVTGNINASGDVKGARLCIGTNCQSSWTGVGTNTGVLAGSPWTWSSTTAMLNNTFTSLNVTDTLLVNKTDVEVANGIRAFNTSFKITSYDTSLDLNQDYAKLTFGQSDVSSSGTGESGQIAMRSVNLTDIGTGVYYGQYSTMVFKTKVGTAVQDFVDAMAIKWGGKVGIGTVDPTALFEVAGNPSLTLTLALNVSNTLFVNGSSVGIRTRSPTSALAVTGDINASGGVSAAQICIGATCRTTWPAEGGGSGSAWDWNGANLYPNATFLSGNVGIGTTAPTAKLDVNGDINASNFNAIFDNTTVGYQAGFSNNASRITAMGYRAGAYNTAARLTAMGYSTGYRNNGTETTSIGGQAGYDNAGSYLTAVGYNAGFGNNGTQVSALGHSSGFMNTANYLTAIGYNAGQGNNGSHATAVGGSAGYGNTAPFLSVIGFEAGAYNNGTSVVGSGYQAAYKNTAGNVVAMGSQAGYRNNGTNLVALGYQAGYDNTKPSQFILRQGNVNATPLIQGDFANLRVGIGTDTPSHTLTVPDWGTVNLSSTFFVTGGKVGVGTGATPLNAKLTVDGGATSGTNVFNVTSLNIPLIRMGYTEGIIIGGNNMSIFGESNGIGLMRRDISVRGFRQDLAGNQYGQYFWGAGVQINSSTMDPYGTEGTNIPAGELWVGSKISVGANFPGALLTLYNSTTTSNAPYLNISSAGVANPFVYVAGNGDVGLGQVPAARLDIKAKDTTSTGGVRVVSSTNGNVIFTMQDSGSGDRGYLSMFTGGAGKVVLDTAGDSYLIGGDVGIGTVNPSYDFEVNDTGGANFFVGNTTSNTLVTDDGLVGVGASPINATLYVLSTGITGTSPVILYRRGGSNGGGGFGADNVMSKSDSDALIYPYNSAGISGGIAFYYTNGSTGKAYAAGINYQGRMGIGTTAPSDMLTVTGSTGVNITNTGAGSSLLVNDEAGDTTPFIIDGSGNVGIGTATPTYKTQINDNGLGFAVMNTTSNTFVINGSNVGIGTNGPRTKLDINLEGTSVLTSAQKNVSNNALAISGSYVANNYLPGIVWYTPNNNPTVVKAGIWTQVTGTGSRMFFGTSNGFTTGATNSAVYIDENARVGINTTSPSAALHVNGTLRVEGNAGSLGLVQDNSGRIGVATATPTSALHVTGDVNVSGQINAINFNASTSLLTAVGYNAGYVQTGTYNTYLGYLTGYAFNGSSSTMVGYQTGYGSTANFATHIGAYASRFANGSLSVSMGYQAGEYNTAGSQTAIGYQAGWKNTGAYQTAIGREAGYLNNETFQTAVGSMAGQYNSGTYQAAIGYQAGWGNTGAYQMAIGPYAGRYNNGSSQVAIGYQSGEGNNGSSSVMIGHNAGIKNYGTQQTAIGHLAGGYNTGLGQTAIGYMAGIFNNGTYQTAIGYEAGYSNLGARMIAIGLDAGYQNTGNDLVAMGYGAGMRNTIASHFIIKQAGASQTSLMEGDFANSLIGIGINNSVPSAKLDLYNFSAIGGKPYLNISSSGVPAPHLIVNGGGKVGIGTATPVFPLSVNGIGAFGSTTDGIQIRSGTGYGWILGADISDAGYNDVYITGGSTATSPGIVVKASTSFVGINTTSPTAALHVNGTLRVESSGGSLGLVQDNSGRVGIGTATPTQLFEVQGISGTLPVAINRSGYLALGTLYPSKILTVVGSANFTAGSTLSAGEGTVAFQFLNFTGDQVLGVDVTNKRVNAGPKVGGHGILSVGGYGTSHNEIFFNPAPDGSGYDINVTMDGTGLKIGHDSSARDIRLLTSSTARMIVAGTGQVGISNTNPTSALHVTGDVNASGGVSAAQICLGATCRTTWPTGSTAITSPMIYSGANVMLNNSFTVLNISNTLFARASGVGIGTNSPTKGLLDIYNTTGITNNVYLNISGAGIAAPYVYVEGRGYLGVGTAAPPQKFTVANGNMDVNTDNYGLYFGNGDAYIKETGYKLSFHTYSGAALTERAGITSAGLFGINTTSPSAGLHMNGTVRMEGNAGSLGFTQDNSGNVGIGTATPNTILKIVKAAINQLSIAYTQGTAETNITTTSSGDTIIDNTGGDVIIKIG